MGRRCLLPFVPTTTSDDRLARQNHLFSSSSSLAKLKFIARVIETKWRRGGGNRILAVWKKTRRFDVCKETQKLAFTMKLVDSPFGRKPMDPQFERKLEDLLFVKI